MKKLSIIFIMCISLVACAFTPNKDGVCDTEEPSLICEKIPEPEAADILLQLANLEALKNDAYTGKQALEFLDQCDKFITEVNTYADLADWLSTKVENIDAEIIILSGYLKVLDKKLPIYDYDRMLLKQHIEHQRKVLALHMN